MARRKRVKQPGRFRKWSEPMINTGSGPNRERMQEYYDRTRSLATGKPLPNTRVTDGRLNVWRHGDRVEIPPKAIIQFKMEEANLRQTSRLQWTLDWNYVDLVKTRSSRLRMFHYADEYMFAEDRYIPRVTALSRLYRGRQVAMSMFNNNMIKWVEEVPFDRLLEYKEPNAPKVLNGLAHSDLTPNIAIPTRKKRTPT